MPRSRLPSAGAATPSSCFSSFAAARRHLYLLPGTARRLRSCRGNVFLRRARRCCPGDGCGLGNGYSGSAVILLTKLLSRRRGGISPLPLLCRPLPSRRRSGSSATARCQRQRRHGSTDVSPAVARAQVAQVSRRSPDAATQMRSVAACAPPGGAAVGWPRGDVVRDRDVGRWSIEQLP